MGEGRHCLAATELVWGGVGGKSARGEPPRTPFTLPNGERWRPAPACYAAAMGSRAQGQQPVWGVQNGHLVPEGGSGRARRQAAPSADGRRRVQREDRRGEGACKQRGPCGCTRRSRQAATQTGARAGAGSIDRNTKTHAARQSGRRLRRRKGGWEDGGGRWKSTQHGQVLACVQALSPFSLARSPRPCLAPPPVTLPTGLWRRCPGCKRSRIQASAAGGRVGHRGRGRPMAVGAERWGEGDVGRDRLSTPGGDGGDGRQRCTVRRGGRGGRVRA